MNENDVKVLEEESQLAFQKNEIEKAYEINNRLSNEFPQSYMFKVKCMNNLLTMKQFSKAKEIYLKCLDDMKNRGCGWKLFETQEESQYLLPMELKRMFFMSCINNGYYEELKEEAFNVIEFYCKAGFNIENSKFCRDANYTLMNGYISILEFEKFFENMRQHGVNIPVFQEAINEYHAKCEVRNEYAKKIRERIIQENNYNAVNDMFENDCSVYVIDRGNYMYHSLCLNKEENVNIDKLYGGNNERTGKKAIFAYMTIKDANSVNPFAICREIKLKELFKLMRMDSKYEAVLINYSEQEQLVIPTKIFD